MKRIEKILTVFVLILIIGSIFLFKGFKTGNVIADIEQTPRLNEYVSGNISIVLEKGDKVHQNSKILVSLLKDDSVLESEILRLKETDYLSDNKYNLDLRKTFNYFYNESGNYEIIFSMPSIDYVFQKQFTIN